MYENLNRTELAALAKEFNLDAHRDLPRELLVRIIEGEDVELPQRVVNKRRLQLMNYINQNWEQVEYQISCPAKSREAMACFTCFDVQTTECIALSPNVLKEQDEDSHD